MPAPGRSGRIITRCAGSRAGHATRAGAESTKIPIKFPRKFLVFFFFLTRVHHRVAHEKRMLMYPYRNDDDDIYIKTAFSWES